MHIKRVDKVLSGVSYSELVVKTAELLKKQKPAVQAKSPTLRAQVLMQDKFFAENEVNETVRANYFSYLINSVK